MCKYVLTFYDRVSSVNIINYNKITIERKDSGIINMYSYFKQRGVYPMMFPGLPETLNAIIIHQVAWW